MSATDRSARLGGAVLAGVTQSVHLLRRADKPLHPRGRVRLARLHRTGAAPPTGIGFLDTAADDEVVVRESRAVGLPRPLPDVHGLALRIPVADGFGDLLFASSGLGRLSRFTLTAGRDRWARPMTTLLPYRGPEGPVELAAWRTAEARVELSFALRWGDWRPFAELVLSGREPPVAGGLSFDPVRHRLPGLEQYDAVVRLREPAYRRARHHRRS